jgi:hypothetical protein
MTPRPQRLDQSTGNDDSGGFAGRLKIHLFEFTTEHPRQSLQDLRFGGNSIKQIRQHTLHLTIGYGQDSPLVGLGLCHEQMEELFRVSRQRLPFVARHRWINQQHIPGLPPF